LGLHGYNPGGLEFKSLYPTQVGSGAMQKKGMDMTNEGGYSKKSHDGLTKVAPLVGLGLEVN